jgi:hypothetical protein
MDDLDLRRNANEGVGDLLSVLAAGLVVVGQDHDPGAAECMAVLVLPLEGTSRTGSRREPKPDQVVRVLLAFDQPDGLASRDSGHHAGQVVEDAAGAFEIPDPVAVPVRAPLTEALGLEANDFEENLALFVVVGIGIGDLGLGAGSFGPADRDAESLGQGLNNGRKSDPVIACSRAMPSAPPALHPKHFQPPPW